MRHTKGMGAQQCSAWLIVSARVKADSRRMPAVAPLKGFPPARPRFPSASGVPSVIRPSAESRMATHLSDGMWLQTIIRAVVNGTLRNAPTIPHIIAQNASEAMTTNGLRFSVLPIRLGSMILPITSWRSARRAGNDEELP